jgi:hypothetical protein
MTMTLIEHYEVPSGGVSSIVFSDIPDTFTDLVVKFSATAASLLNVSLRFNGSSSSYSFRLLMNEAGTVRSYTESAFSLSAIMAGYTSTSPIPSNAEAYIPNYRSSANKSVSVDWAHEINSSSQYMGITAGLWSVTDPITSISLVLSSGSFGEYSSASLFGILAGSDGTTTVS